jgi:hypothetical protein
MSPPDVPPVHQHEALGIGNRLLSGAELERWGPLQEHSGGA